MVSKASNNLLKDHLARPIRSSGDMMPQVITRPVVSPKIAHARNVKHHGTGFIARFETKPGFFMDEAEPPAGGCRGRA